VIAASRAAQAYRRVESESRSPLELVVMLYDGALRFVNDAREAHARKDLRARGLGCSTSPPSRTSPRATKSISCSARCAKDGPRLPRSHRLRSWQ
jgi:hypothetical protein